MSVDRNLMLSVKGKQDCINVGVGVIRILDNPTFVTLLINLEKRSIAIIPCEEDAVMSFKVPKNFTNDRKIQFRIHSKAFVHDIIRTCGFDAEKTYHFFGKYDPERKAVVFTLRVALLFGGY